MEVQKRTSTVDADSDGEHLWNVVFRFWVCLNLIYNMERWNICDYGLYGKSLDYDSCRAYWVRSW